MPVSYLCSRLLTVCCPDLWARYKYFTNFPLDWKAEKVCIFVCMVFSSVGILNLHGVHTRREAGNVSDFEVSRTTAGVKLAIEVWSKQGQTAAGA